MANPDCPPDKIHGGHCHVPTFCTHTVGCRIGPCRGLVRHAVGTSSGLFDQLRQRAGVLRRYYPPINNGVYPTYGGYGYNPYVTGYRGSTYFPTYNYRTNMAPYIRHYGYPGCW